MKILDRLILIFRILENLFKFLYDFFWGLSEIILQIKTYLNLRNPEDNHKKHDS